MKRISDKSCRETRNTHFTFNNPPESTAAYNVMWKNVAERGRPQMQIWCICIARWIPKVTNAHTHTHTHTHTQCNTHCFSTATMVARTLHVHCLSCSNVNFVLEIIYPRNSRCFVEPSCSLPCVTDRPLIQAETTSHYCWDHSTQREGTTLV